MIYEKIHLKEQFAFLGVNDADPTLELYLPYNLSEMKREQQKRPCMLVLPGGAYAFCSQRESEPIALHFLPEGYNVFVLTYSVAPHRFPTQLREVAAALELIHANADKWNCDVTKIALMGFSAGGHLAAHYATQYDCAEVREVFPQSKKISASVLSYPVITADWSFTHQGSMLNLLGHQPTEEDVRKFSNEKNVREDMPPTFLWHTVNDETVPVLNSIVYAKALAEKNVPFELHIYPCGDHGLATADSQTCDNVDVHVQHVSAWLSNLKIWLKTYMA